MNNEEMPKANGGAQSDVQPTKWMSKGFRLAVRAIIRMLRRNPGSAIPPRIVHQETKHVPYGIETELTTETVDPRGKKQVQRMYSRYLDLDDYRLRIHWHQFGRWGPMLAISSERKGPIEGSFRKIHRQLTMVTAKGEIWRVPEVEINVPLTSPPGEMSEEKARSEIPSMIADMFKHLHASGVDSIEDVTSEVSKFAEGRRRKN